MPQYKFVSAKEIIARVIRALGYKLPSHYHDDLLEWIAEGLSMIQVTNSLELKVTGDEDCPGQLYIRNYCVALPCGFQTIESLTDSSGNRLEESSFLRGDVAYSNDDRPVTFNVNPFTHPTTDGQTGTPSQSPNIFVNIQGGDLTPASKLRQHYYVIKGNYIQTSFEEGFVKLRYWAIPTCKEGYPLIPDNQNFKQALEWYVIKRLIGSGYEHKTFNYQFADNEFEKYAARGMGEVSYRSVDTAARVHNTMIRLIPPVRYREDYFVSDL